MDATLIPGQAALEQLPLYLVSWELSLDPRPCFARGGLCSSSFADCPILERSDEAAKDLGRTARKRHGELARRAYTEVGLGTLPIYRKRQRRDTSTETLRETRRTTRPAVAGSDTLVHRVSSCIVYLKLSHVAGRPYDTDTTVYRRPQSVLDLSPHLGFPQPKVVASPWSRALADPLSSPTPFELCT